MKTCCHTLLNGVNGFQLVLSIFIDEIWEKSCTAYVHTALWSKCEFHRMGVMKAIVCLRAYTQFCLHFLYFCLIWTKFSIGNAHKNRMAVSFMKIGAVEAILYLEV